MTLRRWHKEEEEMPKAKVNGININYRVQGKGEPFVLIMGYSGDQTAWGFQTRAFRRYYRVITFDNRGVGKSDKPDGAYSTKMMADDTVGLMDHLDIKKAHVLGVSMGGMIAQAMAINYPERINKLVLGCTVAGRDGSSGPSPEWPKALGYGEDYTDEDVRSIPIRKMADTIVSLAFNRKLYRIIFVPVAKIKFRLNGNTGLLGQWEAVLGHNTLNNLPAVKVPTLVIAGTKDRVIKPSSSEVIAKLIPNAKLVQIDGGSHMFNMEMSGRFNKEVLVFLRGG
jgi:pimeloyl-ACP methyl ester carboxylesterase